jgi:thymidylate synthase
MEIFQQIDDNKLLQLKALVRELSDEEKELLDFFKKNKNVLSDLIENQNVMEANLENFKNKLRTILDAKNVYPKVNNDIKRMSKKIDYLNKSISYMKKSISHYRAAVQLNEIQGNY